MRSHYIHVCTYYTEEAKCESIDANDLIKLESISDYRRKNCRIISLSEENYFL